MVVLFSWDMFLLVYLGCLLSPFLFSFIHLSLGKNKIGRFVFLKISFNYFILINVVLRSLVLGFVKIEWGKQIAVLDHINYSFVFTEYGLLFLSIGVFGIIALFSKGSFRIAPSIFLGIFLILVSIAHWNQVESNILLAKSRYYLLIIFDVLTAVVLFYHSWLLKKYNLLKS